MQFCSTGICCLPTASLNNYSKLQQSNKESFSALAFMTIAVSPNHMIAIQTFHNQCAFMTTTVPHGEMITICVLHN